MTSHNPSRPTPIRVGFIPLTDCAPLAMAVAKGFDRKHGIEIVLSREPSWAAVRDKLLTGQLDAAHALYGLVYGVQMGIGGPRQDMAVLMTLNRNGQAITLSRRLHDMCVTDGAALAALIRRDPRRYTFAQTFPTGTHALWLYYWLASQGLHPFREVSNVVVPPPQMSGHLAAGNLDGFCAGEPWNALAMHAQVGFTVATSQDIWPDHPEKVLACSHDFTQSQPGLARALIMAVLEAARFLDTTRGRSEAACLLAGPEFVNVPQELIEGRLQGRYHNGLGRTWQDAHAMAFCDGGEASFPWLSDGMWFLTQHYRWGMLDRHPDYLAVARRVNRTDLYREAAAQVGVPVPKEDMRRSVFMDGRAWDGSQPAAYAEGFAVHGSGYRQAA
jgi:nitrate/nitrite transport system substrate-binding protein